jgi:alanine dehydrogenase
VAFQNNVRILDINFDHMEKIKAQLGPNVSCLFSNRENLVKCIKESDVIINCIMWPKHRKDHLIYREDLKMMKKGAMIVDVACDDEGAVETCRSTTHDDPVYYEEGVKHYCVDNIPSAFARTASTLLANATLPFLLEIAGKGVKQALKDNAHLRKGLTAYDGKLTLEETALKQNRPLTDVNELVANF